jgi:hypothetical protein
VVSCLVALTLALFGPFAEVAFKGAVLRFDGWPNWDTLYVWNCGGLYMPATTMNFVVYMYRVKANYDQICNLLRARIQ